MHNNIVANNKKSVLPFSKADADELKLISDATFYFSEVAKLGFVVPESFVITSYAYFKFIKFNNLQGKINNLLSTVHYERADSVMQVANHINKLFMRAKIPEDIADEIEIRFRKMGTLFKKPTIIVGVQRKELRNLEDILTELKNIWASNFSAKHLVYSNVHKTDLFKTSYPILIQKQLISGIVGSVLTSNLEITTQINLNEKQKNEIKKFAEKVKKHIYTPLNIFWTIDKNKIFVTEVGHQTNIQRSSLVLVRHGESKWNVQGLWTGWTDIELSEKGYEQARDDGLRLKDIHLDMAYTSTLKRAQQSLDEIKLAKGQVDLPTTGTESLNERNYGDLTGKNKWELEKDFGKEKFEKIRRGWDTPIKNGETLKDVYHRVVPFYMEQILPKLKSGNNIIVAAHGNSLRALVKHLENITDEDVEKLEIPVGEILIYKINEEGEVVGKEIRNQNKNEV